jgi:hypothetical protein
MKQLFSNKWWIAVASMLLLLALSSGAVSAQTGTATLTVTACDDQNADGQCVVSSGTELPAGVMVCLNDTANCLPAPAAFTQLVPGTYTPFLRFTGESEGYYPTTPRTPITLAGGEDAAVTLGAVYPIHPKGIAVHTGTNKVYAAFQGPTVLSGPVAATTASKPYPFVAVIDSNTDEVIRTIPGGTNGIGEGPWGIATSGDYAYVAAFEGGRVSVIDVTSDQVIANITPPGRTNFQPTTPVVNPLNGRVHVPDYKGGRLVILEGTTLMADTLIANEFGFSPLEMVVANTLNGYNFITMRDAIVNHYLDPDPFKLRLLDSIAPYTFEQKELIFQGEHPRTSGSPHAVGLWEETGRDPRLFVTYAEDTRDVPFPAASYNPNKLAVYSFSAADPKNLLLRNEAVTVGDFAEVGLTYDPDSGYMLGTYGGFFYTDTNGHVEACSPTVRGGTYALDYDGNLQQNGDTPEVWRFPERAIGNPPLDDPNLQWKNPFEIAINPNNGKIYVTDRCWNDYRYGGQIGGGAVMVFTASGDPIVTPTITPSATFSPTVTPTPAFSPTVTPTPALSPTVTPTPAFSPTITPTPQPNQLLLVYEGPATVAPGESFSVTISALNVGGNGLYGVQFDGSYDPALIAASGLQLSSSLEFVLLDTINQTAGSIQVVASRQGAVPGLTGDVVLATFNATATGVDGDVVTFSFANVKIGDSTATALNVMPQSYSVTISSGGATPTPTPTPGDTPTSTPTPNDTPTPTPTPDSSNATISGRVILGANSSNDWSGATVVLSGTVSLGTTTDTIGAFTLNSVPVGSYSVTADAPGYLSAVCSAATVAAPTTTLNSVSLVVGDINGDDLIDISDATAVGVSINQTGSGLAADLNADGVVDIFDLILVNVNFLKAGPQVWTCQ